MPAGGGASLTASVDGIIEIPVGGSAGFDWNTDSSDGTKHTVSLIPMALGTVSFTLGGADRVAFAVYSADDDSLDFYKRMDVPEVGDTFEGKTVTAVYTGFETDMYGLSIEDNWNGPYTTPWYEYKDDIRSVKIIDDGIEPANTRFWFGNLSNVESIDLSKIRAPKDQSDCYLDLFVNCKKLKHIDLGALASVSPIRMDSAFAGCSSLKSVDLSRLDTSGTQNFAYLFQNCTSLEEIKGVDTLVNAGTNRIECMFQHCKSLSSLDLSGWIVNSKMIYCLATFYGCNALSEVKVGRGFCVPVDQHGNYAVLPAPSSDSITGADGKWYSVTTGRGYAPANIPADAADTYVASKELLPKVAFSVYSADDGSLDFYNRLLCDVPAAGSMFEDKVVTDVYTGVETDVYTGKWVDYKTDCPWSPHSFEVKSVRVVDAIRPKSISWWFTKFYNCTSFDGLDLIDTSECTSFQRTFSHCNQITELQGLGNWDTSNVTDISCIFDGCMQLSSIPGIDGWNVSKVEDCSQAFFNCQNLVHLDLSKWSMSPKGNGQGVFACCYLLEELDLSGFDFRGIQNEWTLFKNDYSLKKVTFGPNWKWVGTDGFLPAPSAEYIPGADGKWYSTTTGTGYTPADIPSGKADTYVASKELLPKIAFAVYSADDGSLDFYKRAFCDVPAAGDTFDGKAATGVYTGFEEDAYTGIWPNDNCPWFNIATKVKSVTVVDVIRPKNMAWWFSQFCNCKSFNLGNIDTSECTSFRRLFSTCTSCISLAGLDRWDTGSVTDLSAMFDGLVKLKTIPGISGWDTGSVKYFAETFYNLNSLEHLNLSNWDDSSLIPGTKIDDIGYSGDIVGTSEGTMKSFKSFTVGSKWSNTVYLARRINLASSGTIPTDGKWYSASDGAAYAPADIPARKADTYVASYDLLSKVAFAVYSADDNSLDFYKRPRYLMPVSGSMFNGKQATEVYHDIEDYNFDINSDNVDNAPWWSHRTDIISVKVLDSIKPKNMTGWFYWFVNVTSIDLGPIDTSEVTSLFGTFDRCFKLSTLDVSMMDTSKVRRMACAFFGDGELTELDLSGWDFSNVYDFGRMFVDCKKLGILKMPPSPKFASYSDWLDYMFWHCEILSLDCSDWNVPVSAEHTGFNGNAPGVIPPKVWQ